MARHNLASIHFEQGEYVRARGECLEALKLFRELGDRHGEASALKNLARIDAK